MSTKREETATLGNSPFFPLLLNADAPLLVEDLVLGVGVGVGGVGAELRARRQVQRAPEAALRPADLQHCNAQSAGSGLAACLSRDG